MSWDIELRRNGEVIELEQKHNYRGGTYVLGGSNELALNVTYNYGKHFDFNELHGLTGTESLKLLTPAYAKLKDGPTSQDYWEATEGNVAQAIAPLIEWAWAYPDGVWNVS